MSIPDIVGIELSDSTAHVVVVDETGAVAGRARGAWSGRGGVAEAAGTALGAAGQNRPRKV